MRNWHTHYPPSLLPQVTSQLSSCIVGYNIVSGLLTVLHFNLSLVLLFNKLSAMKQKETSIFLSFHLSSTSQFLLYIFRKHTLTFASKSAMLQSKNNWKERFSRVANTRRSLTCAGERGGQRNFRCKKILAIYATKFIGNQ